MKRWLVCGHFLCIVRLVCADG